ncbi:MAG: hypothetical protein JSV09_14760 [Thermoplasmata archaeon]|nr:MAG: hypothetical protein JSV09_14760 [Thermoplasmata archaeon]
MSKSEESRSVAPANKNKAISRKEDWRKKCEDCDILRLCSNCEFGCELVIASLKKNSKKE